MLENIVVYHKAFYSITDGNCVFEKISGINASGITWSQRLGKLIYCDWQGRATQWTPNGRELHIGKDVRLRSLVVDQYRMLMGINEEDDAVVRYTQEGEKRVLIHSFNGAALHPKCLAIHSSSYFYVGCESGIYYANPESLAMEKASGQIEVSPTALCMSADESTVLFVDSVSGDICLSEFNHDGTLGGRFCRFTWASDFPKGCATDIKADTLGNIYCAAPDGLHIYNRGGVRLAVLTLKFPPRLLAVSVDSLFVSTEDGIYRCPIKINQNRFEGGERLC